MEHATGADLEGDLFGAESPFLAGGLGSMTSARSEGRAAPDAPLRRMRPAAAAPTTNVVALRLGNLVESAAIETGDPVACPKCGAFFSSFSKLTAPCALPPLAEVDEDAPTPVAEEAAGAGSGAGEACVWVCEFCGTANDVDLDEEEIPKEATCDYILEPPPVPTGGSGGDAADDGVTVFALDVSGSMCVTAAVPGTVKLRGGVNPTAGLDADLLRDAGPQSFGRTTDETYISRLQAVQAAVSTQIAALKESSPSRRVALVTFAGDVKVVGDGVAASKTLAGDRLNDYPTLVATGSEFPLEHPVSTTADALDEALFKLTENGPTALGPAVVVSVAMAARKPGSKVVVCTDGLATEGLGALDGDEDDDKVGEFYARVGTFAAGRGVTIDVVGIEGDGCALEHLGAMSSATGGTVTLVSPATLALDYSAILASPVVATKVSATLHLHHALELVNLDAEDTVTGTTVIKTFGNVTKDSEATFEYAVRNDTALSGVRQLPFQVQVRYSKLNGGSYVRVITQMRATTDDQSVAEAAVDTPLLCAHAAQSCARMARKGDYRSSRVSARKYRNLMARSALDEEQRFAVTRFTEDFSVLDSALAAEEDAEGDLGVVDSSDGEEVVSARLSSMRKTRRAKNDSLASALYRSAASSSMTYSPAVGRPPRPPAPRK